MEVKLSNNKSVQEVLNAISEMKEGEARTVMTEKAYAVRQAVRKVLTREERGGNIVMSMCGPAIVLYKKPRTYTSRLEDMLRRVMMSVDDENLYDEAMKLLEER